MRRVKFWNVVWGLIFIAAACLIVLNQLDMLGELNFWTLVISIPIAAGFIACALKLMWGGMFLLLGALAYIYKDYLGEILGFELSFWLLLGIAVLLSIGFHMIFGGPRKWKRIGSAQWTYDFNGSKQAYNPNVPNIEDATGEKLYFSESFTGASKYIKSDNLSYVRIDNNFGGMEVYFQNAVLAPEGCLVEVDNKFGGVELYIPYNWNIVDEITSVFAGTEAPRKQWIEGAPTVTIRGANKFGGIEIKQV